jgi:hypothetical protein
MAGYEMKKLNSLTRDTDIVDADALMNRRDLLRASTGLALTGLPLLAGAAERTEAVRFTPPFAPPPVPAVGPGGLKIESIEIF